MSGVLELLILNSRGGGSTITGRESESSTTLSSIGVHVPGISAGDTGRSIAGSSLLKPKSNSPLKRPNAGSGPASLEVSLSTFPGVATAKWPTASLTRSLSSEELGSCVGDAVSCKVLDGALKSIPGTVEAISSVLFSSKFIVIPGILVVLVCIFDLSPAYAATSIQMPRATIATSRTITAVTTEQRTFIPRILYTIPLYITLTFMVILNFNVNVHFNNKQYGTFVLFTQQLGLAFT
ncbi:unnamed protein product [Meganyctiphanes norvegica]|uniref:Uncharacterized protein n=1 Tax=Meganyctiphanes norvegica TaxID=48144 RepID=A0AAV2QX58_MEGNR